MSIWKTKETLYLNDKKINVRSFHAGKENLSLIRFKSSFVDNSTKQEYLFLLLL